VLSRILAAAAVCFATVLAVLVPASPAAAASCPCSIWAGSATPSSPSDPDTSAVELGVKFRSDEAGQVTGIRFYKGTGNTGAHTGSLWTNTGTRLGTVTFTGETASGWQQALFATPVAIAANTTYVASYYAPNGRYSGDVGYFDQGVDNAPLHALADGADGANGVYHYGTGGGFPTDTWQSANYWVDVVVTSSGPPPPDTTPPTVTATSPAANATGVAVNTTVSATLSEPIQAGTVTMALAAGATAVPGTSAYDAGSRTVTFTPSAALGPSTAHTATVSGARDPAGNTMSPHAWSFTTGTGAPGCPCTIWPNTAGPATANANDSSAVELGVRFRTNVAGYVTGIRFYKGAQNTGTHTGSLWTNTGTRLGTVTFSGETASGWQSATLGAPVAVSANTTYVASYHTNTGRYSVTSNGFASGGVTRGPLTALANGVDGGNGVYAYGSGGFPSNTFQATNYWVDVVFNQTATDTTPPTLTARTPASGAVGVPATTTVTATFSEPVSNVTLGLTGPGGAVAGATAYDPATTTATFTPTAPLADSTSYTASVSGARDGAGNQMAPVSWSFTTAAPAPPPPDQGPGGPVLVIRNPTAPASQFTPFAAEVLRAEGLNEFATANLAAVTASTLAGYDVVVLGSTPLTGAQVNMFTTWVNGGGNLIAFRPDKQLAGLFGLASTTGTLAEGYLRVDTTQPPGAGITDQTIQYHGVADRYTLAGARAVATLYSNATTATTNPAVSLVAVGGLGGQAAAFAYDLPQSLVYQRQGNPAWDGQERDGVAPIRSDDLFFGGGATDWVNLAKAAIPQADEQQRLLANLIGAMNLDRTPLPRFWYFPRSLKAVVVATGDDHGNGGTAGRFDQYLANSPSGCVVDAWQCPRFTSYVYASTPLSNSQAAAYHAAGFEIGLHVNTGCANFTPDSLASNYSAQLSAWAQKYTSLPAPVTNRTHCIAWSDWSTQASVEVANGIRLDTNYYYWPGSWIANRPGFMTGSGMPMRFATRTGQLIDAYQALTQMTDESDQAYPFTVDTLLDNALGPLGYYGAFVANLHTDAATTFPSDQVLASALAHGVPLITARQLLTWVNGRNASSFAGVARAGNTLTFTVNVGAGANGLTAMVPTVGTGATTLTALTRGGSPVPFTRITVKGVEYASFLAAPGAHTATYGSAGLARTTARRGPVTSTTAAVDVSSGPAVRVEVAYGPSPTRLTGRTVDPTQGRRHLVTLRGLRPGTAYFYRATAYGPDGRASVSDVGLLTTAVADHVAPVVSGVAVTPLPDGTAGVSWRTSEATRATLLIGPAPEALAPLPASGPGAAHTIVATRLRPGVTYHYRVRAVDTSGNVTTWPALSRPPATFVSAAVGVADRDPRGGAYTSRVLDAGQMVTWDRVTYRADAPRGSGLRVSVRTGSTARPDATWSAWAPVTPGARVGTSSRYLQYRVEVVGPLVRLEFGVTHNGRPPAAITEQ